MPETGMTGNDGNFLINGSIPGKFKKWRRRFTQALKEVHGGGDRYVARARGAIDWEVTGEIIVVKERYNPQVSLFRSNITLTLWRDQTSEDPDASPVFVGTGVIEEIEDEVEVDEGVMLTITIKSVTGATPTINVLT